MAQNPEEIEETIRKGYDLISKGLRHAEALKDLDCATATKIDDCQIAKHELHKCLCELMEISDLIIQPRFGGK